MRSFLFADYNPLTIVDGSLAVHEHEIHHIPVNELFHLHSGVISTVVVEGVVDSRTIELLDASLFNVGDKVQFNGGLVLPSFYTIISKAVNVLTFDRLLDANVPIGETVEVIVSDMGVVASAGSPLSYIVTPPVAATWIITRIIFTMTHGTAGDLGLFGNLAALTNGVIMRAKLGGVYGTFTNWKTNSDIKNDMFDVVFDTRSGGGGSYGTSGRGSFDKIGVGVKLEGSKGDFIELMLQDNLSGLTTYEMNAQGYIQHG